MSDKTAIEWTATYHEDGTVTKGASWNPIRGTKARHVCVKISPGCDNCYASAYNERYCGGRYYPEARDVDLSPARRGIPLLIAPEKKLDGRDIEIDAARMDYEILLQPVRWQRGRKIFVCSMTDIAGEWVPDAWLDAMWAVMALAPHHTFQVLTKRPTRLLRWFESDPYERVLDAANQIVRSRYRKLTGIGVSDPRDAAWYPHVWIGVTVESDPFAWRANVLRQIPAHRRWVSAEPLISGLPSLDLTAIDWLVGGGESAGPLTRSLVGECKVIGADGRHPGPGRAVERCPECHGIGWAPRAQSLVWARELRDRCRAAGTAFFWKQWGGPRPKSGGRLLDGVEHNEFPRVGALAGSAS